MKRFGWLVVGIAACMAAGMVHAGDATGRLMFVGSLVNEACTNQPMGMAGGLGSCSTAGSLRAVYVEQTSMPNDHSGIAMLDYFADRPDGGQKRVVTRQYR